MAKKAEKAAAKQQQKGQPSAPPTSAKDSTTTNTTNTAKPTGATPGLATLVPPAPLLQIVAPAPSPALLKVVWTAQLYGTTLHPATTKSSNNNFNFFAQSHHPQTSSSSSSSLSCYLQLGDSQMVGGGGNAMATVIASLGSSGTSDSSPSSHSNDDSTRLFLEQSIVEEWCEWERSVLRHATPGKPAYQAALQYLETYLTTSSSAGLHLVGHADTLADVCVLVTLHDHISSSSGGVGGPVPTPAIAKYVQAHENHWAAAQAAMLELVDAFKTAQNKTSTSATFNVDLEEVSLYKVLHDVFVQAVLQAVEVADAASTDAAELTAHLPGDIIRKCQNPKHGDYQCTAAMRAFGMLSKKKKQPQASGLALPAHITSPPLLAEAIVAAIGENHPVVMQVGVQEGAFVVCRLRPSFLERQVNTLVQSGQLPFPKVQQQVCLVDFSSPNIAKEMHVGHLRSTIIGESVCRILEAVGHTVHRVNHVGDWGTQFGMLIQYLREEYPAVANSSSSDDQQSDLPNITDLTEFYKNAKARFDENPDFKKQSQTNVVQLQSGDPDCLRIWHMLCDVSRVEFEKVYQRLDVTLTECGESFYNDKIPAVIEEFDQAGLLKSEEGGAKVVFVDKFKNPLMLQKSDGGYGYDSTDMAALKYRLFDIKANRIIVITDFSQGDHFKMVYSAGRAIGWVNDHDPNSCKLEHIGFGTVMGEDGKRFKTRSGDTVRLVDLLDEAVHRMSTSLKERMATDRANITEEEVQEVAEAIGYGAVKYYDLRRNPTSNYKFSYDQMLDTKGDTAVYLLYARVRLESIMTKAKAEFNIDVQELIQSGETITLGNESERSLALALQAFADTIVQTLDDLYPYHICEYVYKLANAASDFITQCKVLGSTEMKSRLLLCYATTIAMKQSFDLLGIRHVKRI